MFIIRLSKIVCIAAIALFATLVIIENIFHPSINFPYVQHVFMMDTVFPDAPTMYRAIENPTLHRLGYGVLVFAESMTALLCWIGAYKMFRQIGSTSSSFNLSKKVAIAGLTLGFLVWHVAFMSVGGEWFGMWMSKQWNGVPDAFRFFITILVVLIYVVMPDTDVSNNKK